MEEDKRGKFVLRGYNYTNKYIIKSPKLKSIIVENILGLLYLKDFSISELLTELQRTLLHYSSFSFKSLKKYLVYLVDYELISYNGQKQLYSMTDNGLDLLIWISREKKKLLADSTDITITIERGI